MLGACRSLRGKDRFGRVGTGIPLPLRRPPEPILVKPNFDVSTEGKDFSMRKKNPTTFHRYSSSTLRLRTFEEKNEDSFYLACIMENLNMVTDSHFTFASSKAAETLISHEVHVSHLSLSISK